MYIGTVRRKHMIMICGRPVPLCALILQRKPLEATLGLSILQQKCRNWLWTGLTSTTSILIGLSHHRGRYPRTFIIAQFVYLFSFVVLWSWIWNRYFWLGICQPGSNGSETFVYCAFLCSAILIDVRRTLVWIGWRTGRSPRRYCKRRALHWLVTCYQTLEFGTSFSTFFTRKVSTTPS